jgi:nucleoside-diphosphate-sugar epimerase
MASDRGAADAARYGRAVDVTRLVEEVGFQPRYDMDAAVQDYLLSGRGTRTDRGG